MQAAIVEAQKGKAAGEAPIGAVVVQNSEIIAATHTSLNAMHDPSAHAEMLALREAAQKMRNRYLQGAVLYTTLEPCPMCMSAAIWAKCDAVVFGATQEDAVAADQQPGRSTSLRQIRIKAKFVSERGVPEVRVIEEFMRDECLLLLTDKSKC